MSDLPERPDYDDREHMHELVMPFKCVKSVGGPYDDDGFTAGFQCGQLFQKLSVPNLAAASEMVYETLEQQADLIAMLFNLTVNVLWRGDGWVHLGFTRPPSLAVDPNIACGSTWHATRRVKRAERCPVCGEAS